MAKFTASATGPYSAKGTLTGVSKVSYARTVYITVVETGAQDEWNINANATPSTSYTTTFRNLEPNTTYTIACTVFRNSPWEQVAYWEQEITTDIIYYMKAVNKSTSAISEVYPDQKYEVEPGTRVYFQANMNYGYIFRGWYNSSSSTSSSYLVSRDNPYSFKIYEDTTLYARASSTSLITVEKTYNSITIKLSTAYDYGGATDYRINVYDVKNNKSIISERSISYDDVYNGYTITNLEANTTYAINIGYVPGNYADGIIWIWKSGSAPQVKTTTGAATINTEVYIQNADGTYPSSANYIYSYDAFVGDEYDIENFANIIYTTNLKNSMSSTTTNTKLYANLEFDYMTSTKGGTHQASGTIYIQNEGEGTIYFYFNRITYYMTLAATTGITDFLINNVYFNVGQKLSFLYGQSIEIQANLLDSYEFSKWTTNPTTITAVHNKTDNPLSFTMPASNFIITANASYKVIYYNVKLYCFYENSDDTGFSGGLVNTFSYASGTTFSISNYKEDYLTTGFYFWKAQDGNTNEIQTSITITKDTDIEFYYKRNVWVLTLKGGTGVSSFTVNGTSGYASGSALSYKYEQTIRIQAVFKDNYGLDYWSSSQFSGLSGNPITVIMPNNAATITVYAKVGIADWIWKNYEIEAFQGKGTFSTLTAERWNEFLDWCNEVLTFKGKPTIGSAYYGEKNQPLYASDFNYIIDRLEAVAIISNDISSIKTKGDIIKGSYFIDIANAMNNVL